MQCIQVLKEAICHYSEGQNLNGKKVFSPSGGVMQMSSDTRDSSVTTCTLTVTDFNLFSSAVQEETNPFELL